MKALTASEMREVDRLTTERHGISGTQLMENAGTAVAEVVRQQMSLRFKSLAKRVFVLCGKGNNGGDGLVAARHLRQEIRQTVVLLIGSPADLRGDAASYFQRWREASGETLLIQNDAEWSCIFADRRRRCGCGCASR